MARHVVIFFIVLVCLSSTREAASTEIRPALAAFIEGRYADAEDSLKTLFAKSRNDRARICYLLGRINTWEGDIETAFDWFEKAVKAESETADYQYWLGMLYGARAQRASIFGKPGKARRARKAFEMAVRLDPNHIAARIKLLEYHLHAPGILGGSREKALKQASEIASRNTMEGHMAWALIHAKEKAQDKREKAYLDAVALANGDVRPVISLATLYLRDDRRLDAIRVYETYLQSYPDRSTILRRLSNQYRLEKENDKAYQAARRSLEMATEALAALAADSQPDVQSFENALRAEGFRLQALYAIGRFSALTGMELDLGFESLTTYLRQQPARWKFARINGLYRLGRIYARRGEPDLARDAYRNVLKLNKDHKGARKALEKLE
ncbi:MAG: tetratricopeptide repeat protein [Gemmatimonadota bacterium]|nr:tetratricopeptide repeat protein [Gemmatimonadota bacterium]